jgi:hypothetical protein
LLSRALILSSSLQEVGDQRALAAEAGRALLARRQLDAGSGSALWSASIIREPISLPFQAVERPRTWPSPSWLAAGAWRRRPRSRPS